MSHMYCSGRWRIRFVDDVVVVRWLSVIAVALLSPFALAILSRILDFYAAFFSKIFPDRTIWRTLKYNTNKKCRSS